MSTKAYINIRTIADFAVRHYLILRGNNTREYDLTDLATFLAYKDKGSYLYTLFVLNISRIKVNNYGRLKYASAIRYKDVL